MRVNAKTLRRIADFAWAGRVVVFDTETTGGTRDDEICQLAAAEYRCGVLRQTLNLYLRPSCGMDPWAEAIHGLSLAFLEKNGMPPAEALDQFFTFLGNDVLLVAHNIRFDMGMLRQTCLKYDVTSEPVGVETCDSLALARHLRPGLDHYSLAALIRELCVDGVNSHDALDDTLACAGVFFTLLADYPSDRLFF